MADRNQGADLNSGSSAAVHKASSNMHFTLGLGLVCETGGNAFK